MVKNEVKAKAEKWMEENVKTGLIIDSNETLLKQLRVCHKGNPKGFYGGVPTGDFIEIVEGLIEKAREKDEKENR